MHVHSVSHTHTRTHASTHSPTRSLAKHNLAYSAGIFCVCLYTLSVFCLWRDCAVNWFPFVGNKQRLAGNVPVSKKTGMSIPYEEGLFRPWDNNYVVCQPRKDEFFPVFLSFIDVLGKSFNPLILFCSCKNRNKKLGRNTDTQLEISTQNAAFDHQVIISQLPEVKKKKINACK